MKAPQNTLSRIPRPVSAVTVVVLLTTFLLPLQWAVVATILAVLATTVMILSIRQGCVAYRVLAHPLLVKVGLISYSLYLWHWGVLAFSRLSIGISWWTIPFQVLLMAALAIASYRTVESPLRKLRWSPRDGWTIAIGISALIVAAALLLGFRLFSDQMYLGKFKGKDFEYVQARMSCELMNIKLDRSQWRSCLDRSGVGPHLFVLGDSHASNLVPSLQAVAPGLGFVDLRYLTNAMPHPFHTADTRSAANFWGQSKEYRQWIEGLNSQDVVVFTRGFSPDPQAQRSLRQQLTLLAAEVPARGATLVLVDDIPRTCDEEDFRRGFLLTGGKGCRISKQEALAHRAPYTQLLQQVSQGKKGIVVLDPLPELCEGNACYPTLRGKILYVDTSPHFSLSNPAPLAPFFRSQFSQRGLGRPSGEELP